MGSFRDEEIDYEIDNSPRSAMIPWIDIHGHHHTLTWREHREFELSGCSAVIMTGGLANESPYRPMTFDDVRSGWDRTIQMSHAMSRSHLFNAYATIGVHTSLGPIDGLDNLLGLLPKYADYDEVVAISETGISMIQEHEQVQLEEQRNIVRQQLHVGEKTGLPAILHTPTLSKGGDEYMSKSLEAHSSGAPVLDPESPKLEAVKIDVAIAEEVGFPEDMLVFTHGHPPMASWILENTNCYVSFTVGNGTRETNHSDVADAVKMHGPSRIMIDSDSAAHKELESFAMKKTINNLIRQGLDPSSVEKIVYENQKNLIGI